MVAEFNRRNALQLAVGDVATGQMKVAGAFCASEPEAFTRMLEAGFGIEVDRSMTGRWVLNVMAPKNNCAYLTENARSFVSAMALGEAIANLLAAYRLTGDSVYVDGADRLAHEAIRLFFDGSALPRASSEQSHYEAITGGDTLVMELLDLWALKTKSRADISLVWTDR